MSATRGSLLNVKAKLKLIHYLLQQNGKPLFYIFLICTQIFTAGVSTNQMRVILLLNYGKMPSSH